MVPHCGFDLRLGDLKHTRECLGPSTSHGKSAISPASSLVAFSPSTVCKSVAWPPLVLSRRCPCASLLCWGPGMSSSSPCPCGFTAWARTGESGQATREMVGAQCGGGGHSEGLTGLWLEWLPAAASFRCLPMFSAAPALCTPNPRVRLVFPCHSPSLGGCGPVSGLHTVSSSSPHSPCCR